MSEKHYGGDDDEPEFAKRLNEFECPDCDATNPVDDGFADGDEVLCFYCGMEYFALFNDSGKVKFKPT